MSVGIALIVCGIVISCTPDTTAPVFKARSSATPTQEAASPEHTPPLVVLQPFTDQACLKCHTDQAALKALALVKPAAESLSSGPG